MILIYIPCKNNKEAEKISRFLLENKLIVCVNLFPIKSLYNWKGKVKSSKEIVILAKTNQKNFSSCVKEVKKLHSYKIPCIIKLDAKVNNGYFNWAEREMK
ncbi:MAG: divalent-cation tolerance protein CutA [Nanoarchaeota archaeon]|nr:divalent-cation tolerance protein CutA [Nanoarchaeota archaeon]